MSDTDVLKMKVADLKRELKLRGLPITGNKTELQERLQSVLLDGDLSLEDTAISEDVLLDDDVLTDEEVPVSPISEENSILVQNKSEGNASATESKMENDAGQPKKPVVLKRKPITMSNSDTSSDEITTSKTSTNEPAEKISKIAITTEGNEVEDSDDKKIVKLNQLSLKERMEMRAKKFGTSNNTTVVNKTQNNKIHQDKINTSDPKTIEALKKRAERFGVITAPEISAIDKEEKLKKRIERFGSAETNKAANRSVITTNSNPDYAEKAKMRLERFKTTVAN